MALARNLSMAFAIRHQRCNTHLLSCVRHQSVVAGGGGQRVAIVTGGLGGLGRAFTQVLLKIGVNHVVLADVNPLTDSVRTTVESFGKDRASYITCDVADPHQLRAVFAAASSKGNISVVCNNAGVADELNWRKQIDINLSAVIEGTYMGVEYMREHGRGGHIVNIASLGGVIPQRFCPTYSATKAGVIGFTRSLDELSRTDKIHVSAICPGYTKTPFIQTAGMSSDSHDEATLADMRAKLTRVVEVAGVIAPSQVGDGLAEVMSLGTGAMLMCTSAGNKFMRFPMGDAFGEPLLTLKPSVPR